VPAPVSLTLPHLCQVRNTSGSSYTGHFLNVNIELVNNVFVGRGISSSGGWDNVSFRRNVVDIRQAPLFEGEFCPTITTRHNIGHVAFSWGTVDANVYHNRCAPNESECATFPQVCNRTRYSSFKEWQATGRDSHSVEADPMFINRDGDGGGSVDLRFRLGSPASARGIQPVDIRKAGLLK
jgi:hypothetical protein